MGFLKELNEKPKVTVDNIVYVPEELYKQYIIGRLETMKIECVNKDEEDGLDLAIDTVFNS